MKPFYTVIITLLLAYTSIYAQQADRVLVDGDPPLTQSMVNNLIDFFEFGLGSKFNAHERSEFQTQRVAEWQSSDPKKKEALLGILDTRAKLMQVDDAKLREAQASVQKYLLDTFGNQPDDPTARLLMEVYNNGHSPTAEISSSPIEQPSNGGSGDSSALLGTWQAGTVSGVNFVNGVTGSSTNGGGTQVMYTFKPGNRYEYAGLTQSTLYNCTMKFLTYKTGIVDIRGGVVTFIPQRATFTSQDSCVAKNNYEKPAGLDRETFNWSVQRDEYGTKLCLQNATTNGCAYKH